MRRLHERTCADSNRHGGATRPRASMTIQGSASWQATDRLWQQDCDLGMGSMVTGRHRAQQGRTLIQKRYAKRFPVLVRNCRLPHDVELALPVGRFGTEQLRDHGRPANNLVPWGQSPLHLASMPQADDLIQIRARINHADIVVIHRIWGENATIHSIRHPMPFYHGIDH